MSHSSLNMRSFQNYEYTENNRHDNFVVKMYILEEKKTVQ